MRHDSTERGKVEVMHEVEEGRRGTKRKRVPQNHIGEEKGFDVITQIGEFA